MRPGFRPIAEKQKVANVVGTLLGGEYVNRMERRRRLFALRKKSDCQRRPR